MQLYLGIRSAIALKSLAFALCASFPAAIAVAQGLIPDKSVSVRDRPRPEYDARGIYLGIFRLAPQLSAGVAYDDNIYATQSNATDDAVLSLGGQFNLASQRERLPISLYGRFSSLHYSENSTEDQNEWETGAALAYVLAGRNTFKLNGSHARAYESRGEPSFPTAASAPLSFTTTNALSDFTHEFAHGKLSLRGGYQAMDFDGATLSDGTVLSQDFRDRNIWTGEIQGDLAVGKSTAVFLRVTQMQRDYRQQPDPADLDRDATAITAVTGAGFMVTNLVGGEVGVGVLDVDHQDPRQGDRRSFTARMNLDFYLTQLMTAVLTVQRTSDAADLAQSASYIGTSAAIGLDYELRRNLIFSLRASRTERDYSGIDRTETIDTGSIDGRWLLNRNLAVRFGYRVTERESPLTGVGRNYSQNVASMAVELAL